METRLSRDSQGASRAAPILELPGAPPGYATTGDRKLLLLTWNKLDADDPACPWTEERRLEPVYVLRISPDGAVESLP